MFVADVDPITRVKLSAGKHSLYYGKLILDREIWPATIKEEFIRQKGKFYQIFPALQN